MGDLFEDTAVVGGENGQYTSGIRDDWAGFGPLGGYLAAIALRAAGAASQFERPATFSCHYLSPADFGPVQLSVRRVFGGKRTESLHVTMTQGARAILEATAWTLGEIAPGLDDHGTLAMPESPPPESLSNWEELPAPMAPSPRVVLWRNIDLRLIDWQGWHAAGEPRIDGWYRFRPRATMPDAFTEAARSLVIMDAAMWLAAMNPHVRRARILAPTVELTVRFYHPARTEWLRCHARSDIALGGLIDGRAMVWSRDGALVAHGGCQMLYRAHGPLPSGAVP